MVLKPLSKITQRIFHNILIFLGEHLQLALNSHDGSMFLEQPNHIPEEYHKYFGIQPIISSPRSESNTLVTNPEDDENSNSMMSANSEKEGLGAQMVLEQNLGTSFEKYLYLHLNV